MHMRQKSFIYNITSIPFAHRRTNHVLIHGKRIVRECGSVIFAVMYLPAYQLFASLINILPGKSLMQHFYARAFKKKLNQKLFWELFDFSCK